MAAAPQSLVPGQWFRGLRVHSQLGSGAFGVAYLASHPVLQMPMVVKTFAAGRDDLFCEAHLAARVASPHVVTVVDAGIEDGVPFIVTRYVDGLDMQELVSRLARMRCTLPPEVVIHCIADVARGLHSIHQTGVIHRDIKPANLFLRGDGVALVGDFGIAVDPTRGDAMASLAGTPQFIAPEVWRGESIDARADVYSLGATAHRLATGEPPFPGDTLPQMAEAHAYRHYAPPATDDPAGAFLFAVIQRMLAKSPDDRYLGAGDVAEALARVAADRPQPVHTSADTAQVGEMYVGLMQGDMAQMEADVLVNAANGQLSMRQGVANALRLAGGDDIEDEARRAAPAGMGAVVWTGAGRLRARWMAHAVSAQDGAVCIQRCTLRALLGARARGATSVIFPALGTGVGDVPMSMAAKLILEAVHTFAWLGSGSVQWVGVALYDAASLRQWRAVLASF